MWIVIALALVVVCVVVLDRVLPGPMARLALALQHALGGLRVRSVDIPGFTISYLDGGRGEPLVLVHGIGADKDNFAPIAPWLRGLGRLIALDLPVFASTPEEYAGVMRICFTRPPFVPHSVRHTLALAACGNYTLHTRIFRELVAQPFVVEQLVAGLSIPALIVWGDQDRVLDVSA